VVQVDRIVSVFGGVPLDHFLDAKKMVVFYTRKSMVTYGSEIVFYFCLNF